mgnify:CR=1 FL=1
MLRSSVASVDKKQQTFRQADCGPKMVPPPTVPTSTDGIVQLNKNKNVLCFQK